MARKKKDPAQEATPAPATVQEAQEQTTPLQEQEDPVGTAPEITPEPDPVPAPPPTNEEPEPAQEEPAPEPAPEPDPVPPGERPTPYRASVAVPLAVVHKEVGLGTAEMLKAVGSLRSGTTVTVANRNGSYAQLKNGLYILEALLEVLPSE